MTESTPDLLIYCRFKLVADEREREENKLHRRPTIARNPISHVPIPFPVSNIPLCSHFQLGVGPIARGGQVHWVLEGKETRNHDDNQVYSLISAICSSSI